MDEIPEVSKSDEIPTETETGEAREGEVKPSTELARDEGIGEEFFADVDKAREQNQGFIDLVKGRDYFEIDENGQRVMTDLEKINQELTQLEKDYREERGLILKADDGAPVSSLEDAARQHPELSKGELTKLGFVKHLVETGKIGGPEDAPRETLEGEVGERVEVDNRTLVETLQRAGYQIQSEKDLPNIVKNSATTLQSDPDKSLVMPEEKLAIVDQLRQENSQELNELLSLGYRLELVPLVQEKGDVLSLLIFLIKLLTKEEKAEQDKPKKAAKPKYLMLVRPEYYYRAGGNEARSVQNFAKGVNAEVAVLPEGESEKVAGKMAQLKDGKVLLPEGAEETKNLLAENIGAENIVEAPVSEPLDFNDTSSTEVSEIAKNDEQ